MHSVAQPKHQKMVTGYGMWIIRSLYRTGSLKMVARELGKCTLDLVSVLKVRWGNIS
jgi:hypothetical protein